MRRDGATSIVPYLMTESGCKINFNKCRALRGSGCLWDCRAVFWIRIGIDSCFFHWSKGVDCSNPETVSGKTSVEGLNEHIVEFYRTNSYLEKLKDTLRAYPKFELNSLEIWLTPKNDKTDQLMEYTQSIANAYLNYQNIESKEIFNKEICEIDSLAIDSLKNLLPLRIFIAPRPDLNRTWRLMEKEGVLKVKNGNHFDSAS